MFPNCYHLEGLFESRYISDMQIISNLLTALFNTFYTSCLRAFKYIIEGHFIKKYN